MPISNWSTTASGNATADSASGISWPEGMSPAQVNDSARAMMAEIRKDYDTRQSAYAEYATYSAVAQIIPYDDTIPLNTEGVQLLSVSITPSSTSSKLLIEVDGNVSADGVRQFTGALFLNSTVNAIAAKNITIPATGYRQPFNLVHQFTPGTTTAQTINLRIGMESGTGYINGVSATRLLGGVQKWTIRVSEVRA